MKSSHFKRTVCLLTAALLFALTLVPAFAAGGRKDASPVLIITGFSAYPLSDTETGRVVFPIDQNTIASAVTEALPHLLQLIASPQKQRDYDAFYEQAIPIVLRLFEPITCNPDGSVRHEEVAIGYQYLESAADYEPGSPGSEVFGGLLNEELIRRIGPDRLFVYGLDWRLDPFELAEGVHEEIEHIKEKTGCKKVSVAGSSMGGAVLNAYIHKYGAKDLSNITMISSAFTGVGYVGELFKGKVKIDEDGLYEMITEMVGAETVSQLLGSVGVLKQAIALMHTFLYYERDRMYKDFVLPGFAYNSSLWSFVPSEDFDAAKKFIFSLSEASAADEAVLMAKIDAYHQAHLNMKANLKKAQRGGASLVIFSNYNLQMPPVTPDSVNNGDQVIETMYTSGGATCAPVGGVLPDSIKNGKHVSSDRVIDASTCMFPDNTWFLKNVTHMAVDRDPNVFYAELMTAEKPMNVYSDPARPQFMKLDSETKKLVPLKDKPAVRPRNPGPLPAPDLSSVIDPSALSGLTSMLDPSMLTDLLGSLGGLFGGGEPAPPPADTPVSPATPEAPANVPAPPTPPVTPAAPAVPVHAVPSGNLDVAVETDTRSSFPFLVLGAIVLSLALILSAVGAPAAGRRHQESPPAKIEETVTNDTE